MKSKRFFPIYGLIILLLCLTWRSSNANNFKTNSFYDIAFLPSDTSYRIIPSINNTYGYEILIDEKVFIRQQSIPGLPGLSGFKRKEDAEKVAQLVLKKLSNGEMPPSVEKKEMDKLKIKY